MKYLLLLGLSLLISNNIFSQDWENLEKELRNYVSNEEYEKAIPLARMLVDENRKRAGEENPKYITALIELADLYSKIRQYSNAEPLYIEAKDIRKKILGENNLEYAKSLNDLGFMYENMGEYEKAEPLYIQVKNIRKLIQGQNHPDYASSVNNLALVYFNLGQYEKAELLYIHAKEIRKNVLGENHTSYAESLNNLAVLYESMGQYEKAESLYIRAKEINKNVLGENHPDYASDLNNLAVLYAYMGQYEKAEPLLNQAERIRKKVLGENHPEYAINLNNLAMLYFIMGKYEKAEPLYIQTKEIRKKVLGESHPDYALSLNNLAGFYGRIGQYEKAEPLHIQAKEINKRLLGENHPDYAGSLNNLADTYKNMGQYEKAQPLYMQALEINKRVLGENHPNYANTLNGIASLYESMGDYEKAEPLYIQAGEITKKVVGENHPDYALNLSSLARLSENMGGYEKSKLLYIQAMEINKRVLGENHPDYALSLSNLAGLYQSIGQYENAEPLILQNTRIVSQNLLKNFSFMSDAEKQLFLKREVFVQETGNSFLYKYKKASLIATRDIANTQLFFKGLILDNTRSMLASLQQSRDTVIHKRFNEWLGNKNHLSKQYALSLANRRSDLKEVEEKTEQLEKELNRLSLKFRNQQNTTHIHFGDVQKKLERDEIAIEFVTFKLKSIKWTDSIIYAAYIFGKSSSAPVFVFLFEERQLQKILDSAGKTTTGMVNKLYRGAKVKDKSSAALGKQLYQLVWQPLQPYLKNINRVSYSPAGKLYGIAFHALPVDSTTILIDKYLLTQYTSTRQVAIREKSNSSGRPQSIALFGDASFSMDSVQLAAVKENKRHDTVHSSSVYTPHTRGSNTSTWPALPGTADEVNKINDLFSGSSLSTTKHTQNAASEENLKSLSGNSPQVLHIATHGYFLRDPDKKEGDRSLSSENSYTLAGDPLLRTGLILSGGNYAWSGKKPIEGVEDGIVTSYEISQLNLSGTELVVLSACETALGDVKGSEGVFGLQRAFKIAGVKKMIVSLWQVPDKETAELMTAFYNYWLNGNTIEESFGRAQADMRKKHSTYYWAAFVLLE